MFPTLSECSLRAKQKAFSCHVSSKQSSCSAVSLPAAGCRSFRRPTECSPLKLQQQLAKMQTSESSKQGSSSRPVHHIVTALAASGLAAMLLMCPGPVLAEEVPEAAGQEAQALSMLLPAGSLNLSAAEAPALVADSGSAMLEGVKGIVESGLQDLAANSMTAVGGPVTSDVLSASVSQAAADNAAVSPGQPAASVQQPQEQQQQQQQHPQQQQQQRQRLPAVWCNAWQAYCEALERSPLLTKVYTGVVGTLIGDLAAQILSHTGKQQQDKQQSSSQTPSATSISTQGFHFDVMRAARLCLYSAVIGTPMSHVWYGVLESAVLPSTPLAPAAVAAKVGLDQLVQTPFGMALFFAVMKVLEGKPGQVQQELQSKMVPALLANWKLWPAAQLINFTLIPEEQRILYGNIVGICWTCVISNMQQATAEGDAAATAAQAPQPAAVDSSTRAPSAPASPRWSVQDSAVGVDFTLRRRSSSVAA